MHYFGGKARIAKELAAVINSNLGGRFSKYAEPFCGALNVIQFVNPAAERHARDFHPDLIKLYLSMQNGFSLPTNVSEEAYQFIKASPGPSALRGFVGFACSFAGKFFGGYARETKGDLGKIVNFAERAGRTLADKFKRCEGVTFKHEDFLASEYSGFVIYCDPPYANTTGYSTGTFDSEAFWQKCRDLSEHNLVFISEYAAPPDFVEIWRKTVNLKMRSGKPGEKRIEKLFTFI